MYRLLGILALGTIALGLARSRAPACGTAGRHGADIQVASESALILWDAESKTQHFIRRATFHTNTPDFGFLVPTPAQPTLAEVKTRVFHALKNLTAPEVIRETQYVVMPPLGCLAAPGEEAAMGKAAAVRELDRQRVAGYDAVVLEADNARALNDWLTSHAYVVRTDLTAWLAPYVKKHWKITAFKIARDATKREIATSAVRMSFVTEQPFFPYSEPADQGQEAPPYGGPRLRVYFISGGRYEGKLGDGATQWSGKPVWAGSLSEERVRRLAELVKQVPGNKPVYLTEFEDHSFKRPGSADVFFHPSESQTEIRRPAIHLQERVYLGGWVCLGSLLLFLFAPFVVWGRRIRRAESPQM